DGKGGYKFLAKEFGIPSPSKVKLWVDNYRTLGDEALMRSRKNESFTFEYKLHVVELYLTSEVSYQELALQERIHNPT
ncbi:helix-turn-helix domain-containing protein, partial [Clostridium neonatale]